MNEKAKINVEVFKRLLSYWKKYKLLFFITVLCTLILAFIGPIRPMLVGYMVDEYVVKSQDAQMLLFWTMSIVGLLILDGVFQFLSSYFANLFAQSIIRDIRQRLMRHILSFRMRFFDQTPIGSLVTRLISDLEAITDVFSSGVINIAGDLIALIVIVVMMLYVNWQLTLLVLIPIPLLVIATRIFARFVRKAFQQEREQVNRLNNFVQERISGMYLVQLFNRQEQEFDRFKEINDKHRQAHINAVWAYSIFFPVVELLSSLSIAVMLVWSGYIAMGYTLTEIQNLYGELFSFVLWIHMLYRPIRQLADKFNILQRGTVRAERVFDLLDRAEHIQDEGVANSCDFHCDISFDKIYFAYKDEQWVLKDINLTIKDGSTIAFVGATGAGKSSIVNLLGRFYEFQKGSIRFGDTDIRDIELDHLRKNVAIVLQDVFLFSDTIFNNITLSDPEISRERVIEAAKQVGAHDFIMRLPGGYDYQVGERGGVLSAGQRQLIAFIRAYVYNPHILILDEATSSVDTESEEMIQSATEKLTTGRTSIIIAHRLSTIQKADVIVVLDKGEIKEMGSHQELLNLNGLYRRLYDMQFSEENEEK